MSITCRPDINYAIGKTSRGMHQPTPVHAGCDGQKTDPAIGFADANFSHVSDEQRKYILGYCFFVYFC